MGACTNKQDQKQKSIIGVPDCFYFNRSKGVLINIQNRKIQKIPLKSRLFYSKDTAIGILSRKRIMFLGGSTNEGLVSKANILNLDTLEVLFLPDIPIQCKLGQLHEIGEWIYYIGGQRYEEGELVNTTIFRFSQKQSIWQEIKEPQRDGSTFKFSGLRNFGSCVLDKKIFIFGGQRVDKLGNLKASKLILSLTVEQGFLLRTESKLPIKINNPVVAAGEKHAIVVGGNNPGTGEFNCHCFCVMVKESGVKVQTTDALNMHFNEYFPPLYTSDYAVFISYPNVAVRFKNANCWRTFHIKGKKSVKNSEAKSKIEKISFKVEDINEVKKSEAKKKIEKISVEERNFNEVKNEKIPAKVEDINEEIKEVVENEEKIENSLKIELNQKKNSKKGSSSHTSKTSSKKSSIKPSKHSSKDSSKNPSKTSSNSSSLKSVKLIPTQIRKKSSNSSSSDSLPNISKCSSNFGKISSNKPDTANIPIPTRPNITISALDTSKHPSTAPKVPLLDLTFNPFPQSKQNPQLIQPNLKKKIKKSSSSSDKILKGKNDAHEVLISIKDNKRASKELKLIRPNGYNAESSSSSDSIKSISLTSSNPKSGSKLTESDKSDKEPNTVDKFLRLTKGNSSNRSSNEKEVKPSENSPIAILDSDRKNFESCPGQNTNMDKYYGDVQERTWQMRYRPTSPNVPIMTGSIEIKLPVIGTPKNTGIEQRVRTPVYRNSSENIVVIAREPSSSSSDSEDSKPRPSHPPTARPLNNILRPNQHFLVKNVVKKDSGQIRLTPKSEKMERKAASVLIVSRDLSDKQNQNFDRNEKRVFHKPESLGIVPEFNAEESLNLSVHIEEEKRKSIVRPPVKSSLNKESLSELSLSSKSSSESSFSEPSESSSSFQYKRKEKIDKSVASVDSSDVSDNETDGRVLFTQDQGQRFLQIVCKTLEIEMGFEVPKGMNVEGMSMCLGQLVPKRSYTLTEELFKVLNAIHECVGKAPLKEKEKWSIVMSSNLLPENTEITGEQLAYTLSRSFKYILLRQA